MQISKTYTSESHDYFDDLVALFISLAALETALTCYANGGTTEATKNQNNAIHIGGRIATYSFHTFDLMHGASKDKWPTEIIIYRSTPDNPPSYHESNRDLSSLGIQRLVGSLVGSFFLKWYESKSDALKSKHGKHPIQWPDMFRFAWVLRNAIAHGDKFTINNPSFPTTQWRGFEVKAQHTGRIWFDLDAGFLGGGDVLELVADLHDAL